MSSLLATSSKNKTRKRQRITDKHNGSHVNSDDASKDATCCFCAQNPAALHVKLPVLGRKKRAKMPYCLRCYFTSSAVRQGKENVSIMNSQEQQRQLPAIQTLFSTCFLELQQEISKESVEAVSKRQQNRHDPLALLLGGGGGGGNASKRKQIKTAPVEKKKAGDAGDGGFLRTVDIPSRLKQTQEQQARAQRQQLARMEQAAVGSKTKSIVAGRSENVFTAPRPAMSLSNRRKGSRKSIWNLAMDQTRIDSTRPSQSHTTNATIADDSNDPGNTCSSCGSKDVKNFGNITSRNGDVRKGEVWETDRDSTVVTRYQCNHCGRTWNEEE